MVHLHLSTRAESVDCVHALQGAAVVIVVRCEKR
jgi:hypothetical protein